MGFIWPQLLWLLAAVPLLVGIYVLLLQRRRKGAVRYASVATVKAAMGPGHRLRRHIPPVLFLLAMIALILATARPSARITLPTEQRTIILAMDVSLSMRVSDVKPSRLAASQIAAKAFVQDAPPDLRIGIVTFAGTASVVQGATKNREDLVAAIDRFQMQRHTALGSAIIASLATLFPDQGIDLESILFGRPSRDTGRAAPIDRAPKAEGKAFTPVPPGSYPHAAIILLTDGRRTTGPDPVEAARMAAQRGVRVYTVGFGTAEGGEIDIDGWAIFMRFDEETLKSIASITAAEYFHASSAEDLKKVYEMLSTRFVMERGETELTAFFAAAGALLALAAGVLSLLWFGRAS